MIACAFLGIHVDSWRLWEDGDPSYRVWIQAIADKAWRQAK